MKNTFAVLGTSLTLALSSGCSILQNKINHQALVQIQGSNELSNAQILADMNERDFQMKTGISSSFLGEGVYTNLNPIQKNVIITAFQAGKESIALGMFAYETAQMQVDMAEKYATEYAQGDIFLHRLVVTTFLKAMREYGKKPDGTIFLEEFKDLESVMPIEEDLNAAKSIADSLSKTMKSNIPKKNKSTKKLK
ncbi:hypothetical protein K2X92_00600 [Candidatus Gracilibacteria bacterium]|nr:hypothetical protein [Candidatus Gracilibacteria bacterium]